MLLLIFFYALPRPDASADEPSKTL
jgi:hypothetical protein